MSGTKLFQRNRALGFVSNHVTGSLRYMKKRRENVIVTCVGHSFHVYGCNTFRLLSVSGFHPEEITCLASDSFFVYSACQNLILVWKFGHQITHTLKGHNKSINLMLPFGEHLISVDEDSLLKIWEIRTETEYLEIPFRNEQFKITAIMHPLTYINKILIGSEQGKMQLWNIKDAKLIHTFKQFDDPISVIEQAPAVDVAAIGLKTGKIVLLNLKYEEIVMEFNQDWGCITGITFRTDGHPIMATSSTNGQVVFWNLEERKVVSQLRAHHDSVTTLKCLPNEPLMVTTSPDNSLKLWIFDRPDDGARLLRERQGHAAPPSFIRFHGANGQNILSAGEDGSLRVFNTITELLNKSLGIASYNRNATKRKNRFEEDPHKMPPIIKFTTEVAREKEWDNIVALHSGLVMATTWSYNKQKMGDLKLVPPQYHNKNPKKDFTAEATSVCLTHCGNFVIIGYSKGDADRFNVQSGLHRASYGNSSHYGSAIRGVASDMLNQIVMTGSSEGTIKFWNFKPKDGNCIASMKLECGILIFETHRESSMLCVGLEDFSVSILDLDTRVIIRRFKGHSALITDICFSPDGRWLFTSGMDCTIKIWDIPSSYLIDHFKIDSPCIALSMSPTGQFLATAHSNDLGIYLWANKTIFSHVSLRAINPDSEPPTVELPTTCIYETGDRLQKSVESIILDEGEELQIKYDSPDQLDSSLLTMSTQSVLKWQSILDLDIIKKRNKPKQPPKAPKQAPFFLPTVAGTDFQFDLKNAKQENENSKLFVTSALDNTTPFGKLLQEAQITNDYNSCLDYFEKLGPSMIDYEIKTLSPINGGSIQLMEYFIKLLIYLFNTNLNYELAQSYLGVFLKSHCQEICKSKKLRHYIDEIEQVQNRGWKKLEHDLLYGIGVVNVLRNYSN